MSARLPHERCSTGCTGGVLGVDRQPYRWPAVDDANRVVDAIEAVARSRERQLDAFQLLLRVRDGELQGVGGLPNDYRAGCVDGDAADLARRPEVGGEHTEEGGPNGPELGGILDDLRVGMLRLRQLARGGDLLLTPTMAARPSLWSSIESMALTDTGYR